MTVKPIITRSISSELYRRVTIDYDYIDSYHHETVYEEAEPDTRLQAIAAAWNDIEHRGERSDIQFEWPELAAALDVHCVHEWISMKNEIIESGEMCLGCDAIRPDALTEEGKDE